MVTDILAQISGKSIATLENAQDLWEEEWNPTLNGIFRGRTPAELVQIVRRGCYGIDDFADWIEALIALEISSALLAIRAERLLDDVNLL